MSFISGPYNWTWNDVSLGIVEDAPEVAAQLGDEVITGDNLGDSIQGIIDRGGNVFLTFIFQEWDLAKKAFWPGAADANSFDVSKVGGLRPTGVLKGTAITGSLVTPKLWTAPRATIAPGFNVRYQLGSRLRNVPVTVLCMPSVRVSESATYVDTLYGTNPE